MKFVVALVLLATVGCYVSASSCSKLLNCKECEDDTHCKSCPSGYKLDSTKVCRYDCSKYGKNCVVCTEKKCLCPPGQSWNSEKGDCIADDTTCTKEDGAVCDYCGKGYNLIDVKGKCRTCSEVFGEGCLTCSGSKCLTLAEGYQKCGAVVANSSCPEKCEDRFPGCKKCSEDLSKCEECDEDLVPDNGFCKFDIPTCKSPNKTIWVDKKLECKECSYFDKNCVATRCSASGCTMCKTGYTVVKGKCSNCTKLFDGCGLCNANYCTRCRSSSHTLTPNGCLNQDPYEEPTESNAGLIAGIVVAAVVLVALIILALYCIITSQAKKGTIDPSMFEDDFEFKSMSVL